MNARRTGLLVLVVVGLLGLQAAGAMAATRTRVEPAATTSSFNLRGSDGFYLEVSATAKSAKRPPKVTVEAVKERYKVEQVSVADSVGGRWLPGGGFAANLPGLGSVSMRFEESKSHEVGGPGGCKGKPTRFRKGVFRGKFNFRGQRGFTVAHGTSAPGQIREKFKQTCRYTVVESGVEEAPLGPMVPAVLAVGQSAGASVYFSAAGPPATEPSVGSNGIPTVAFFTRYLAHRGIVQVEATTAVDTGSYLWHVPGWPGGTLTDANAEPPAPFTGQGLFHLESPTTASWTGGLGIDFPGLGHVALTGPEIAAHLCEGLTCVGPTLPPIPPA